MAKFGLAKCGHIRMVKSGLTKCGRDQGEHGLAPSASFCLFSECGGVDGSRPTLESHQESETCEGRCALKEHEVSGVPASVARLTRTQRPDTEGHGCARTRTQLQHGE